jgi:hypothetical protein
MPQTRDVIFVEPEGFASAEAERALAWLRAQPGWEVRAVAPGALAETLAVAGRCSVWFHWSEPPQLDGAARRALDEHVRRGGGLLATLAAATLPAELGWEDEPPDEATRGAWSSEAEDALGDDFAERPRMRGLQSFRGHPLFDGLGGGAYTWSPEDGEPFVRYGYTGDHWPKRGRVIAVSKSFIAMNADRRLAWEHIVGDGWALCIGGYVHFAARSSKYRAHLEHLVRNALERVAPGGVEVRLMGGEWRKPAPRATLDAAVPLPPPFDPAGAFEPADDLRLERAATDERYTLAGSRALVAGSERGGLEEIWFHPFRAVSRLSLRAPGAAERGAQAEHFEIRPGVVTRHLEVGGRALEELTTVAPNAPGVLVELRPLDVGTAGPADALHLIWALETDLRPMWPYPAWSAGRLSYSLEAGALGVQAETGEWLGVRVDPAPANLVVADASDAERSRVRVQAELELRGPVRIIIVGATAEETPAARADPAEWARQRDAERRAQRERQFRLDSGDRELDDAVEWAKWRLSTYRVHVPGLGTSLVAGYDRSQPGEFGDGRPGYAWFFGRDACWTAFACLALGQHEAAREVLEFLGRHQDITGKILHECSTSGVVHYDAADSTPLYLLLAARYLAATRDSETLKREWPHVARAYEFCLSTDTDGDALIENTNVGHGWVEFGRLGAHHVSLYLAGVWVAALSELEGAARALGEHVFAEELAYRGAAARSSLELSFYDPLERLYANGRRRDGSLDRTETIMTAVPLLLGSVREERGERFFERVAGDDFTAPWGVRLVPGSDPGYRPDGYHMGSVWPLFTGWVSLAEARVGRAEAMRRHWEQTARLYRQFALGAWPEVMHGDEPRRIGVTADQAWSTAMAAWPALSAARYSQETR